VSVLHGPMSGAFGPPKITVHSCYFFIALETIFLMSVTL